MYVVMWARGSWCPHELIYCEGENVVNYIIAYICLFQDKRTLEQSKKPYVSLVAMNWNELTLNFVREFLN